VSTEPKILTTRQVADLFGWSIGYVRKGMARHGISEVRGWPEDRVMELIDGSKDMEDKR